MTTLLGDDVVQLLETSDFRKDADDLRAHIGKLTSTDAAERHAAAEAIKDRCNPRWLGDLFIPTASLKDWWAALDALSQNARKAASDSDGS